MRLDAVLVVRRLTVCEDALLVDGQPEAVTQRGDGLRHAVDLERCRRFLPEVVGRCSVTSEHTDADAARVAPPRCGEHIIQRPVCDHIDFTVLVDLDVIVAPKLPVVSRRPMQVYFRLTVVFCRCRCKCFAILSRELLKFFRRHPPHRVPAQYVAHLSPSLSLI